MSWHRVFLTVLIGLFSITFALAENDDADREGGIIGTGILGTITDLGSIYVNGQHIRFDPDFAVAKGVSVTTAGELLPGHTVAVVATAEGDDWRAADIRQVVPLVGPVQAKSDAGLQIMGTTVLADATLLQPIQPGDWIVVSGLWQSRQVIASRLDPVDPGTPARIEGTALDYEVGQPLRIGGTQITGLVPQHIQQGDVVRVTGAADAATLKAERLETGVFAATPQVVFSEGYFSVPTASGLYTLLGADVVSYTDNPGMIDPSARQLVCSNDGRLFPAPADQLAPQEIASILTKCASGVAW